MLQKIYKINFFGGVGHKVSRQSTDPFILYIEKHCPLTMCLHSAFCCRKIVCGTDMSVELKKS